MQQASKTLVSLCIYTLKGYIDYLDTYYHAVGFGGQIGDDVSKIELNFTVPQKSIASDSESRSRRETTGAITSEEEPRPITRSELWLFPNFDSQREGRWYKIELGFRFKMEKFKRHMAADAIAYWKDTDDCMMVDLTRETKNIDRKLQKKNLTETTINVIVTVHHKEEYHGSIPAVQSGQKTCYPLSNRSSNTSFLVVKYFPDESEESSTVERKRRDTVETPQTRNSSSQSCSVREFKVKLQDAFGDWVASPKESVDVGICRGECDIENNQVLFSKRAILKDRLNNLVQRHSFEVSCTPVSLTSTTILIQEKNLNSSYFLVNWPIKVHACGCR